MENHTGMATKIWRDPHAVYSILKGGHEQLLLHLQNPDEWEQYIAKLAARPTDARSQQGAHAPPPQPAGDDTSEPGADVALLKQRNSAATVLDVPITAQEVGAGLHKLNNNRALGMDGYPAE